MTQQDKAATTAGGGPAKVRYRGRHLPMVAVVIAAFIATALAYSGMVLFGLEVAHMTPMEAYALAGFLEVSLVAVALMARNAALEGRPYGVLLTLTWVLSGTSGVFAALHEIAVPTASTPYMVVFRFVPPLVAALMWHLALVGERHLVTGHTLDERRREHRVHQYVTALEMWRDARLDSSGSRRNTRKIRAAHERQRAARDRALKLLTVEDFERRMQVWVERLEAAERHGNRLDTIGASSVKRGIARGVEEFGHPGDDAVVHAAPAADRGALVAAGAEPAVDQAPTAVVSTAATNVTVPVEEEPFAEDFEAALSTDPTAAEPSAAMATDAEDLAAERTEGQAAELVEPVAAEDDAAAAPTAVEPLPETGHTRRVEVFDLVGRTEEARTGAIPRVPTWSNVHGTSDADVSDEDQVGEESVSERDQRILRLAREGLNQREIAEEVEASRSTVSRVLRRFEDQKPGSEHTDDELELAPA
ncbi:helix-turn-helix domain-containing protein [Isoptericola croceus]|uniref:helix-turn-helix domain-containing protein n=1 Tax=Isoptericola croceus TaxID=3031406 RepID=UPI0023F73BCE|nr:helix-turn-helix domain-containing protein [Isoptericola croceus]